MDAGHERNKRRMNCMSCILFFLLLLRHTYAIPKPENGPGDETSQECAEDEYRNQNGICCNKCSPGFKLTGECPGKGMRSKCEKCDNGTYMENTNYYHNCFTCRQCKKNEDEISPCMHYSDTVCACKPEYYRRDINDNTWSCERCKKCGEGEEIIQKCAGKNNAQCDCKDSYYRVNKNLCRPCNNCSEECPDQCLPPTSASLPPSPLTNAVPTASSWQDAILISITGISIGIVAGLGYKLWKDKMKRTPLIPVSEKPCSQQAHNEFTVFTKIPVLTISKADESFDESNEKPEFEKMLPDCVPREIKVHEFFYFVMDEIPVNRFKELMRRLNVSEQDIDRAAKDNCCFADAQYQMLKVWSDKSPGKVKNILPRQLLQEFLDRLKDMNLNSCAEGVENKFCTPKHMNCALTYSPTSSAMITRWMMDDNRALIESVSQ